jgi:hypothetical protein
MPWGSAARAASHHPEQIISAPAPVNDLAFYEQAWSEMSGRILFGDRIYNDKDFFRVMSRKGPCPRC